MGGTEAFPNLGKHCSYESCRQLDFLPFKCDSCSKVFCLDHRSYTAHSCPKANFKDNKVVVCPICATGVKIIHGEDPNETVTRHMQTTCNPSNYAKVMNKPRCTVKRCKEVLTFSNKFHCKDCNQDVCLKHRFPTDHACTGPSKGVKAGKPDIATKFMQALSLRMGSECGTSSSKSNSKSSSSSSGTSFKWPRIF